MQLVKDDLGSLVDERPWVKPAPGDHGPAHDLDIAYDEFLAEHDERAIDVDGQRWRYLVASSPTVESTA